ncbi:MAG: HAD-IA family hydrolase [Elusimicrobiota bacterium]
MAAPPDLRAVAFDFDGVILDSAHMKTKAFEQLFAPEGPKASGRILAYHKANAGISRFVKFRWAYREVLDRPLSEEEERALGERFNRLVEDAVVAADWIPGAREFLEKHSGSIPLYVASGTPETELRRIIERRALDAYFRAAYGSPASKKDILLRVARELGCAPGAIVMVGDARNDLAGAEGAGTRFVGVVPSGSEDPFPPEARVIPDLTRLEEALRRP